MGMSILAIESIHADPAIRGGRPIISGTTLRVSDLAAYHTAEGMTPEELASRFDLDLGSIHAALAYYYQHKSEIDQEIRSNAAEAEVWREKLEAQKRVLR